jgi:hypothetical protein
VTIAATLCGLKALEDSWIVLSPAKLVIERVAYSDIECNGTLVDLRLFVSSTRQSWTFHALAASSTHVATDSACIEESLLVTGVVKLRLKRFVRAMLARKVFEKYMIWKSFCTGLCLRGWAGQCSKIRKLELFQIPGEHNSVPSAFATRIGEICSMSKYQI